MSTKRMTDPQEQQQPSFLMNVLVWLINTTIDFGQWAAYHGERLLTEYKVLEWFEEFVMYSTRQPVAAVILGLAAIVCGLPIFLFACFAVVSSLFTFTGFVFIEGTLLTVGFGLLLCFLIIFGSLAIAIFTAGTATYLGFQRVRKLLGSSLHVSPRPVSDCRSD